MLLILGASGGCGQWLTRLALQRGRSVRAVVRETTPFDAPAEVDVVRGSVLDRSVLDAALDGCSEVVSALGIKRKHFWNPWSPLVSPADLTTRVAGHLTELMPAHGIDRLVCISAAGVQDSIEQTNAMMRWLIGHSKIGKAYADLAGMEQVLAGSSLDWTAVRPVTLFYGPQTGSARVVATYATTALIRRSDVAQWMLGAVEQAGDPESRTPMIG
ncbi:MAG: NAD(P)H-binding protein [Bacteroidota bacterium]